MSIKTKTAGHSPQFRAGMPEELVEFNYAKEQEELNAKAEQLLREDAERIAKDHPDLPDRHKHPVEYAQYLIARGKSEAVGYRLMVYPIVTTKTLAAAEAEEFPTLAKAGMEVKSEHQKKREDRGSHYSIVISMGRECYNNTRIATRGPWCEEGDIVIASRYFGEEIEFPPGSRKMYRFVNDENVLGVIKL